MGGQATCICRVVYRCIRIRLWPTCASFARGRLVGDLRGSGTYVGHSSLELVALELVVGGRTARESRRGQGEQSNEKPVASFRHRWAEENDTGLSEL